MLDPEAAGVSRLRRVLESHSFLGPEGAAILGEAFGSNHLRADLPLYERRLAGHNPLHTLVRLFSLYVPVTEADARAAFAPLTLEEVEATGLVEKDAGMVRAQVGLVTLGELVLVRDRPEEGSTHLRAEHVLGLNPPALNLDALTVRRPVRRALDLGCGGGVQALRTAPHAERVVAVDLNPRALVFTRFNARLNGVENIECRQGDFFEPVKGERFDLVVSNPPYTVSPDMRYVFRDSGRPGGAICEEIVERLPDHLEEGGFATVLCNWALRAGEDWSAPLRRWVEGRGCDAWLLHAETQDPLTYAAGWNRSRDAADYAASVDRWLAFYREAGIEGLGMGAVILRRRSTGPNWVRADGMPGHPAGRCHEQIVRVFATEDVLGRLDDAGLLELPFEVAPDHRLHQTLRLRDGQLEIESAELRLEGGLGFRGSADAYTLQLLRLCDGRRRLGEIARELARLAGGDANEMAVAVAPAVRRLAALGFLMPVDRPGERRTADDGQDGDHAAETHAAAKGIPAPGERARP